MVFWKTAPPSPPPGPPGAPVPAGVQEIANTVNQFIPVLEQVTGLTRRELFLHLMKTGLKGGGLDGLLQGLIGNNPIQKEMKFERIAKTIAIWVPIFVLLLGCSLVGVILFAKLLVHVLGAL